MEVEGTGMMLQQQQQRIGPCPCPSMAHALQRACVHVACSLEHTASSIVMSQSINQFGQPSPSSANHVHTHVHMHGSHSLVPVAAAGRIVDVDGRLRHRSI